MLALWAVVVVLLAARALWRGLAPPGPAVTVQLRQLDVIPEEEDCEVDYYDFHGIDLACGDGTDEWVTREIPFSSLEQEGWGKTFDLDLSEVTELQFFTRERPIHEFQCDLAVAGLRK